MPASPRSPAVTEAYRRHLARIREQTQAFAERLWPRIEDLDATDWAERTSAVLSQAQAEAVRASAGYLAAYISSELGRRVRTPTLDSRSYVGRSRDGRALSESLRSPLIGVRSVLKDGRSPEEALRIGRVRALRMVEVDLMHAARASLQEGIERDPRISGWQRAVRGTCGACLGDIAVEVSVQLPSVPLNVHPGCLCVTQPVLTGLPQRVAMLTGAERFAQMSKAEQDEQFGPEKAEALREERISLTDLVERNRLATDQPAFITEKPLDAVST